MPPFHFITQQNIPLLWPFDPERRPIALIEFSGCQTRSDGQLSWWRADYSLAHCAVGDDGGYRWRQRLLKGPSPRPNPTESVTLSVSQLELLETAGHTPVSLPVITSLLAAESLLTCAMSLFVRLKLFEKVEKMKNHMFAVWAERIWNELVCSLYREWGQMCHFWQFFFFRE